ncbi:hypothetical protein Tco_0991391 [Tanacetum coccineum]|uniref:Reverse transcriptase domain-containing protein n=1 Tax=Tanacetum coccineum TaxID=301880 RepID=A0ABQ5F0V8_9ASTR
MVTNSRHVVIRIYESAYPYSLHSKMVRSIAPKKSIGLTVPEYDLYDLKLTREEDGAVETLDPQFHMGSEWLEILEPTVLDLLLDPTFVSVFFLEFPDLFLLGCVCLTTVVDIDFLGGTTLVEIILVKGHVFPTIVKICLVGFDPLASIELLTPIEGDTKLSVIGWINGYAYPMGTPTHVCVWSCPNFSAPAGRPFWCVSDIWLLISGDAKIMSPRMRTRSAGRPAAEPLRGGTGVRVGRGGRGRRPREEEFCPSHEMQKLETELWNHAMVRAGHAAYTDRFHELASMLTDEAIRNGSIKKNTERRGNGEEPSRDRNVKDENKRTRI